MIDPKQGPLSRTARKAELSDASRKRASVDTASEPKRAGERPFTAKRQFSVVGS